MSGTPYDDESDEYYDRLKDDEADDAFVRQWYAKRDERRYGKPDR